MRHDVIVVIRQVVMTEITAVIATHNKMIVEVVVEVPVAIQSRKRGDDDIMRETVDVVTIAHVGPDLEVEVDHHRRTAIAVEGRQRNIINTTVIAVMKGGRNNIRNSIIIIVGVMMITLKKTIDNAKRNTIAVKEDDDIPIIHEKKLPGIKIKITP
jgi:hypothetical protein